MQDADLFTKHPPDNKQRLDQQGHIGKVPDELLDARLKLNRPHYAHLKAEVAQGGTQVVLACDGSGAFEASDCVTSSRAPDDKAPPASSVLCRAHRCGPSC